MTATSGKNIGLSSGWTSGEDGWGPAMNNNLLLLDVLAQGLVDGVLTAPPGSPAPTRGDAYIVDASATGDWSGKDGQIAVYSGSAWVYATPKAGWRVRVSGATDKIYSGTAWEDPAGDYTLPTASSDTLGGVKIGENLTITDGVLSADADAYTLPEATTTTLGGIKVGANLTVDADGTLNAANADGVYFTPALNANGDLSWTNNGGLDNPTTVNIKGADGADGAPGTNGTNGTDGAAATISVGTVTTGDAGSQATVTNSGTSSAAVLDFAIPKGADGASYTLPAATGSTLGGVKAGDSVTIAADGTISVGLLDAALFEKTVAMSALNVDLSAGNVFSKTITGASTFTFSNPPAAGNAASFILVLTNGGAGTITWPAAVKWPDGTAPTLSATGVDILTFISIDAGTSWFGVLSGKEFS